jgi:hypothetical protein
VRGGTVEGSMLAYTWINYGAGYRAFYVQKEYQWQVPLPESANLPRSVAMNSHS